MDIAEALVNIFRAMGGDFSGGAQPPGSQETPYDALKRKEKEFTLKQQMSRYQPYQMAQPPLVDPNYQQPSLPWEDERQQQRGIRQGFFIP